MVASKGAGPVGGLPLPGGLRARPVGLSPAGAFVCFVSGSSFSGRVFRATFLMLAAFLTIPLLGALVLLDSPIDPESLR